MMTGLTVGVGTESLGSSREGTKHGSGTGEGSLSLSGNLISFFSQETLLQARRMCTERKLFFFFSFTFYLEFANQDMS